MIIACASSSDRSAVPEQGDSTVVSGIVKVTGSDPLVMLVIIGDDERYELVGDLAEELWQMQQRRVTVHGRVVRQGERPGVPARLEVDEYRTEN